jgi:hypothetical protein
LAFTNLRHEDLAPSSRRRGADRLRRGQFTLFSKWYYVASYEYQGSAYEPGKPVGIQQHIGRLDRGLDEAGPRGWLLVSMKDDWRAIYPSATTLHATHRSCIGRQPANTPRIGILKKAFPVQATEP